MNDENESKRTIALKADEIISAYGIRLGTDKNAAEFTEKTHNAIKELCKQIVDMQGELESFQQKLRTANEDGVLARQIKNQLSPTIKNYLRYQEMLAIPVADTDFMLGMILMLLKALLKEMTNKTDLQLLQEYENGKEKEQTPGPAAGAAGRGPGRPANTDKK